MAINYSGAHTEINAALVFVSWLCQNNFRSLPVQCDNMGHCQQGERTRAHTHTAAQPITVIV